MQINQAALDRVKTAPFRAEAIGTIFEHMAHAVSEFGVAAGQFTLGYQRPEDPVQAGDLVPVIILALQPAVLPATAASETQP